LIYNSSMLLKMLIFKVIFLHLSMIYIQYNYSGIYFYGADGLNSKVRDLINR
jgi:hypothetical protein